MMRGVWRFLLLAWLVGAQQAIAEVRDIQMHFLGIEQGLSHQSVTSLCQDEFGFIWIATQDGLNRYDGSRVDVFKPDGSPHSIVSNNIRQLYCDQRGSLYIRSHSRIERYDQRLKRFETLYEGDIRAMACDSTALYLVDNKEVWRIDYRNEACRTKPTLVYSFSKSELNPGAINHLVISDTGLILSSSKLGVVELVDDQVVLHEPVRNINNLYWDSKVGLWVMTRHRGLYCFDRQWQLIHHYEAAPNGDDTALINNNVRSIIPVDDHRYYVGSFGGLQLLDLETGTFTRYDYELPNNMQSRSILTLFSDRQRTLWVGTFHGGVQYHHHTNDAFRFHRIATKREGTHFSPIVCAIAEDDRGGVWLGTEGDGLFRFNSEKRSFERISAVSSNEVIKSLYFDPQRREMWVALLSHGMVRIALDSGAVQRINPQVLDVISGRSMGPAYNITCITEDGLGNLLICTNLGLVRLDRAQMRLEAIDNEAFFRRSVSQIWEVVQAGDYLWMATSFDLIRLSRSTSKVKHYSFADISGSEGEQHIAHLALDHAGTLYLGSSGAGLFRYDAQSDCFEPINHRQGLANGFITAMGVTAPTEANPCGTLYVGHSHGISWLSGEAAVDNYSLLNCSPLTTVNENGLYVMGDNQLLVCGPQGMLVMHPEALKQHTSDYSICIKDILVDHAPVMPLDSLNLMEQSTLYQHRLELPPRHSSVTFEIAHNNYLRLPATELEYCLEGYDGGFTKLTEGQSVTYRHLKAGNYRFVVRALTATPGAAGPVTSFALRVKAPIYARPWFVVLMALLALLGLLQIRRLRIRRQNLEKLLGEEQASAQKLRFFTNLSHEFRTPLTLIMGQVEMLLARQDIKPSLYSKVLGIYRNTERLKGMVDEILDIRRLDRSSLRLQVARHDLTAVLAAIWHAFRDYADQHRIDLRFEAPSSPVEAEFDARQFERVINNLLSNAFKYTKAGGTISIQLTADAEQLCVAVSDTGIGIATEHLDRIFERFWQEEQANAAIDQYGSGIGLSLAKTLMEMHNGSIEVKSRPGHGTTFYVRLPLTMQRDNPHATFIERGQTPDLQVADAKEVARLLPAESEGGTQPKVVLVEDHAEMRELLHQLFNPFYRVVLAKNGAEGLELVREEQPDLVVSDVMMPVMTGFELCKRLKTDFETSHIPVVLLTAYTSEEHLIDGLVTGADDYVAKPFNARILLARCNNIIAQRQRWQAKFSQSAEEYASLLAPQPHDQNLLADMATVLEQHLSDSEFDVVDFARELKLSRTMLFAKLKGLTGQTPNEYILSYRLNKAKQRLVEEPSLTVAEIAYDLGFSTPSYFIRCFRNRFGATPNVWRKQSAQ